jgi:hypothetical protein
MALVVALRADLADVALVAAVIIVVEDLRSTAFGKQGMDFRIERGTLTTCNLTPCDLALGPFSHRHLHKEKRKTKTKNASGREAFGQA